MGKRYTIKQRFPSSSNYVLTWDSLDGRAGQGRLGFHGQGVKMTDNERAVFEMMERNGTSEYIGISLVYTVTDE